jgi:hypothetical protein
LALGLKEQAQKYASILGHNYPNSPWYKASYSLLTKGETLQIKGKKKEATTTVGKVKDKFMGLFE